MLSTQRWEKYIFNTYTLTANEYWAIYEAQGGRCAICKRATGARKRLSIDHDHSCCSGRGKTCGRCVRAILHYKCNTAIGMFNDSPEMLRKAIKYLERHGNI